VAAPDEHQHDVLMEVSASLRLWGGLAALMQCLQASSQDMDICIGKMAAGASGLLALARLYAHEPGVRELAAFHESTEHYSLLWLQAARPHWVSLQQLGCTTWGGLRALPRGGITRRFGTDLLTALDQADGRQPESYVWLSPPEAFEVRHELLADIEQAPALLFAAARQLKLLQAWLRSRRQGVLACAFTWYLDPRRDVPASQTLALQTAVPTQDIQHLEKLLAEQLARTSLPAPAYAICLRAGRCEALPEHHLSLLPEEQHSGEPLHQFIERVAAKLGSDAIRRPVRVADHRPEAAQRWESAQHPPSAAAKSVDIQGASSCPLRPAWLLAEPLALLVKNHRPYYHGALKLLREAHRIEVTELAGGGLGQAATRDYFLAWSEQAKLLWIYRERLALHTPRWFLQGIFE
jgi:protein ImuB